MEKKEQIEKGRKFRKAINKLKRDSKGRFVPNVYTDIDKSRRISDLMENKNESLLSTNVGMSWSMFILGSVLIGYIIGILMSIFL